MAADQERRERVKGLVAIAFVTLLWSANFVAARPAAERFDPVLLTFLRAVVAAGVFLPLAARSTGAALTLRNLAAAVPLALACIAGNQVLFVVASSRTTPAHVALVIATIPVFVALIARLAIGERLAALRWVGIAVAFAGVVLLAFQRQAGGSKRPSPQGDALALLAALAFAAFTVGNKRLVARAGPMAATALLYAAGALLLAPLAAWRWVRGARLDGDALAWASAAYLVIGATLLAYPLFSYALARLTASRVSVFT